MSGDPPPVEIPSCGCPRPGSVSPASCYCSVEDLLRIIRRRYSLSVMNAIAQHQPARYRQIAQRLPQASSSTLAETLAALEAAQLVRHRVADSVPTGTYALTPSGEKLLSRLKRLLEDVRHEGA